MGILYPLGFEEQKNPALKDGIRHKIQNLRSLKQKTDGASRSSAQIENIKRQSLYSIGAIEDLETFDYSSLRGNFGPTSAAGSARPSLSSTHYGLQRQCSSRVTRRSASVEKPPKGRHFHLAGFIMLINVGGAATEEPTAAAAAEYTLGKTVAIAADASTSTDFPLRAERNQKMPPPVLTFSASYE